MINDALLPISTVTATAVLLKCKMPATVGTFQFVTYEWNMS